MFRSLEDFRAAWAQESEATLRIFRALTQGSLSQQVRPGGRTLGGLAWHITVTLHEMMGHAGLAVSGPAPEEPQPPLPVILERYTSAARDVAEQVGRHWSDAMLAETIPMYGEQWTRGATLLALVVHQVHHRGQMTVLMRQAGLMVPGIYGPAYEEWAAMGMAAQP